MLIRPFFQFIEDREIIVIKTFLDSYDISLEEGMIHSWAMYRTYLETYQNSLNIYIVNGLLELSFKIKTDEIKVNYNDFEDFKTRVFKWILFYMEYGDCYDEIFDEDFDEVTVDMERIPEKCGYKAIVKVKNWMEE